MSTDQDRVLAELPLPLGPAAGELDAVAIAIAIEDALAVVLPDDAIDVAHLGRRESIESLLARLREPH